MSIPGHSILFLSDVLGIVCIYSTLVSIYALFHWTILQYMSGVSLAILQEQLQAPFSALLGALPDGQQWLYTTDIVYSFIPSTLAPRSELQDAAVLGIKGVRSRNIL